MKTTWCVLCAVPFRDSVLTKLLQNALGGNSKTVMVSVFQPALLRFTNYVKFLVFISLSFRLFCCTPLLMTGHVCDVCQSLFLFCFIILSVTGIRYLYCSVCPFHFIFFFFFTFYFLFNRACSEKIMRAPLQHRSHEVVMIDILLAALVLVSCKGLFFASS